jgi:lysyl-tRNA synthetase class 1
VALKLPTEIRQILESTDLARQPLSEFELVDQFAAVANASNLVAAERKGALAEWAAFIFRPIQDPEGSPWNTYFGPTFVTSDERGQPVYTPDLAQVYAEIITYWEGRSAEATHPVLVARYADLVWDLKLQTVHQRPYVIFAHRAIDAYVTAVSTNLYKQPIYSVHGLQRAFSVALATADAPRVSACIHAFIGTLNTLKGTQMVGNWASVADEVLGSKKAGLTPNDKTDLVTSMERLLTLCATPGSDQFDPWGAQATARCLAAYYTRSSQPDEVHRVIRCAGKAFEFLAANANSMFAMNWLQPVIEEYHNRGMTADAERALKSCAEKGEHAAEDLRRIEVPLEISAEELEEFLSSVSQGTTGECLERITIQFIPKLRRIRDLLQEMRTQTPLLARIPVERLVGDRIAARAGSIEADPEGRLIFQLAQYMDGENHFLNPALMRIREKHALETGTILAFLKESPLFDPERSSILEDGICAYLATDHVKAIHVLIPQIEHMLRRLLSLLGMPTLRVGRNGTTQCKNLNKILRESAIQHALGEDLSLYLLTLLVDGRGHNIQNVVCHGFATPRHLNQQMADRVIHVLLTLGLVRESPAPEKEKEPAKSSTSSDEK